MSHRIVNERGCLFQSLAKITHFVWQHANFVLNPACLVPCKLVMSVTLLSHQFNTFYIWQISASLAHPGLQVSRYSEFCAFRKFQFTIYNCLALSKTEIVKQA